MRSKLSLAAVLTASLISFGAQAGEGQGVVNFKGSVIAAACSIAPESADQTIDFGQLSKSHLETGNASETKNVDIRLTNCDTSSLVDKTVEVTFGGTIIPGSPTQLGTLGETGTAVILSSAAGTDLTIGTPSDPTAIVDGNNTIRFGARVVQATGLIVTEGDFTAVSNFTLAYL